MKCLKAPSYMIGFTCADLGSSNTFNGSAIPGRSSTRTALTFSLGIDWFFPFVNPAKELSIGISPGVHGALGPELTANSFDAGMDIAQNGDGILSVVAFPIMIEAKLGADAPARRGTEFGLTAGVGYQPTMLFGSGDFLGLPIAMIEGDLRVGKVVGKFRFTTQIGSTQLSEEVSARMYSVMVGISRTF